MATKNCIACAEEIQEAAVLCKHCGTMQDGSNMPQAAPKAKLTPHECNHITLREQAKTYASNFNGGPKIKPFLDEYGDEKVVCVIPKTKKGIEGILEFEMIVTEKTLFFLGYGSFGSTEAYDLSEIDAVWISEALIGQGSSDQHGLLFEFETEDGIPEERVVHLGVRDAKAREKWLSLVPQVQSLAAHLPVGETGEMATGGYHTTYSYGFFQSF